MLRSLPCVAAVALFTGVAGAGPVTSAAQLESILGDRALLEDFEGVSIFGGGTLVCPNPLNSTTQPQGWGILPGVSYAATEGGNLAMHAGYLHGDSSNLLQGSTNIVVTFNQPQAAIGFDLVDGTGNVPYHDTVVFYRGTTVLGTLQFDLTAPGDAFAGWQDAVGITSARVTSVGVGFSGLASIDNVEWGIGICTPQVQPPHPFATCSTGTATFSVAATGSGSLTYRWQWQQVGAPSVWTNVVEGVNVDSRVGGNIARFTATGAAGATVALTRTNTPQGALEVVAALRCIVINSCGSVTSDPATLTINSADFNNDGDIGTDADIEAFFACLSGTCCPTCGTADFNGDGDVGTDADIEAFFRVLAGGNC